MKLHPDKENSKQKHSLIQRLNTLEETLSKVHNDKFDYSKSLYSGMAVKMEILCPIHGSFWQIPESHKNGIGCSKCSDVVVKYKNQKPLIKTIEEFINVHGDLYDYSEYYKFYDGAFNKSNIICRVHGVFMQEPTAHKGGAGCPHCANEKTLYIKYKNKKTTMYYIKIDSFYKIGLTQTSIEKRFRKEIKDGMKIEIIYTLLFEDGFKALELEQKILGETQHLGIMRSDTQIKGGWTEIRSECIFKYINKYT